MSHYKATTLEYMHAKLQDIKDKETETFLRMRIYYNKQVFLTGNKKNKDILNLFSLREWARNLFFLHCHLIA